MPLTTTTRISLLSHPSLRSALVRFVRSRAPASEVDDIVQATLADALASPRAPEDGEDLTRWVHGIAKNKIADFFRKNRREVGTETGVADEPVPAQSQNAEDLLRWARRELPGGEHDEHTLEWMLREGDGEKLEAIAASENVPAPRVRQRVARLRKHFRLRWAAAAAAALVIAVVIAVYLKSRPKPDIARPAPRVVPTFLHDSSPAEEERRLAFEACDQSQWQKCLDHFDKAKALDPAGDSDPKVQAARGRADAMLHPFFDETKTKAAPSAAPLPPQPVTKTQNSSLDSGGGMIPGPMPTGFVDPPGPKPAPAKPVFKHDGSQK